MGQGPVTQPDLQLCPENPARGQAEMDIFKKITQGFAFPNIYYGN